MKSNTCPLCRYQCFSRQPRPCLKHEIIQDIKDEEPNDDPHLQGESMEDFLVLLRSCREALALALTYFQPPHLGVPV